MTCAECRGACCEDAPRVSALERLLPWVRSWLAVRGPGPACRHLVDGACAVYATRPLVCRAYPVDGAACREVRGRLRPGTNFA